MSFVYAQNIMAVSNVSGLANDTVTVSIDISNSDPFVGFQFDIELPDELEYVENTAFLSERSSDHQVVANISDFSVLTIFSYSMTLTEFSGTSGEVLTFKVKLGTVPGNYNLNLENVTIANAQSQNILTDVINGIITIQAPDIDINPVSLNYGRVPLLQTSDKSFNINNTGNRDLLISRIYTDFPDFEVIGDTNFTITAGSSRSVSIRFTSNNKGTYNKQVRIQCNDPDEPERSVDLSVIAYAVNELDINNMFGRSGHVSTLSIDISNMEEFVAFSFDLDIPEALHFVSGSAELTERKSDHVVSASTLENGNVRIVAYSTTNSAFTGNSGDVVTLDFMVDGEGGYYSLNFVDPVIGDLESNNIISDDYNGTLEIAAPDIYVNPSSLNFGNVSVFDTLTLQTTIYNQGIDTLNISNLIFYDAHFFTDQVLPVILPPGQNTQIPVSFHHSSEAVFNSTLRIRSNDPDEDPYDISLSATSFIPNIMRIDTSIIVRNDTGWVDISIENHETFVAFQCDLQFADNFTYLDAVVLSDRAGDHSLTAQEKSGNIISIFSYSLSQQAFSGEEGVIVSVKFLADGTMGNYPFSLDNVIIGNSASENIMSSYENGIVRVITSGPTLSEFPSIHINEDQDTLMNINSLVTDPNTSYEDLIWTFSGHDSLSLNVINNDLHIEPVMNWFGERTVKVLVSDGELS
ncbi:MAG: choice-of-anchor D domain-containing protein, partial [Candidatus Marinimicrobia bacterium]|nr:choice-of-anchor D domain-containing protein [Candidatus Neomarinimicrobiota bacterium]